MHLKRRGKGLVAVSEAKLPPLTAAEVRDTLTRLPAPHRAPGDAGRGLKRSEAEMHRESLIEDPLCLGRDPSGPPDHALTIVGHDHGRIGHARVPQR